MRSGTLVLGSASFPIPVGGGVVGILDDETGELEGQLTTEAATAPAAFWPGAPPEVGAQTLVATLSPVGGPGGGVIDPGSGEARFSATLLVSLRAFTGSQQVATCTIYFLGVRLDGVLEGGVLTLAQEGFFVPPPACDQFGDGIADAIRGDSELRLELETAPPVLGSPGPTDPALPTDPVVTTGPPATTGPVATTDPALPTDPPATTEPAGTTDPVAAGAGVVTGSAPPARPISTGARLTG